MRLRHRFINSWLNLLWRVRPRKSTEKSTPNALLREETSTSIDDEANEIHALIRRFPYWLRGRALLAERSLRNDNIATAYAEALALQTLAPSGSHYHTTSLFLIGRCFLRRGDPSSALPLFGSVLQAWPLAPHVLEEEAAALVLQGDRAAALASLRKIPESKLSAEGKSALRWLSTTAPS